MDSIILVSGEGVPLQVALDVALQIPVVKTRLEDGDYVYSSRGAIIVQLEPPISTYELGKAVDYCAMKMEGRVFGFMNSESVDALKQLLMAADCLGLRDLEVSMTRKIAGRLYNKSARYIVKVLHSPLGTPCDDDSDGETIYDD